MLEVIERAARHVLKRPRKSPVVHDISHHADHHPLATKRHPLIVSAHSALNDMEAEEKAAKANGDAARVTLTNTGPVPEISAP